MLVVLSALFLLTEALPGDHADSLAGADVDRAEQLRDQWGLDGPVLARLARWWGGVFRGTLGVSFVDGHDVLPRVLDRLVATLTLAVPAAVLATGAAILLAFAQAWWAMRPSGTSLAASVGIIAGLPEVVLIVGLVLLLAVTWQLVPAVSLTTPGEPPWSNPAILVLPILALTIPHAAWGSRMLRGSADDLLASDIVISARKRGVPVSRIALRHVMPRWLGPIVQTTAFLTAGILSGSVVVESMLAYPGLGQALASSVASRDTPTVQGVGAVVVGMALALLTIADLVAGWHERKRS